MWVRGAPIGHELSTVPLKLNKIFIGTNGPCHPLKSDIETMTMKRLESDFLSLMFPVVLANMVLCEAQSTVDD